MRMSDFKSNEYANLIGGKYFEPEENPMIGFRVLPLLQRF
jgi:pyruvate,water dikinase